jgi:UrcA family protein
MTKNTPWTRPQSFVRLAAVAASIVISGYAEAGSQPIPVSETVSTVGIDVNTPRGASKLYVRLKAASRRVCGDSRVGMEVPPISCSEDALGNAVRSANLPQLTLVYLRWHSIQTAQAFGVRIPALVAKR